MRTYSHAALTYATLRLIDRPGSEAMTAALGATLPDLPVGLGAAWLWTGKHSPTRKDFDREVCGRSIFRLPDAAAHSFLSLSGAALVLRGSGAGRGFLVGWAGHLILDFLTHSSDARPQFWPLLKWRFKSPVSYRERARHGRIAAVAEHTLLALALALAGLWRSSAPTPRRRAPAASGACGGNLSGGPSFNRRVFTVSAALLVASPAPSRYFKSEQSLRKPPVDQENPI